MRKCPVCESRKRTLIVVNHLWNATVKIYTCDKCGVLYTEKELQRVSDALNEYIEDLKNIADI